MDTKGFIIAAVVFVAALAWFGNRSIYFPMKYPEGDWDLAPGSGVSDVWIETADKVRLHGWFAGTQAGRVVLFLHGNAGNVTHRLDKIRRLNAAGMSRAGAGLARVWTERGVADGARAAERMRARRTSI